MQQDVPACGPFAAMWSNDESYPHHGMSHSGSMVANRTSPVISGNHPPRRPLDGQREGFARSWHGTGRADTEDGIVVSRSHMDDYNRQARFDGWKINGCGRASTHDTILARDMENPTHGTDCRVTFGLLHDPHTGRNIRLRR